MLLKMTYYYILAKKFTLGSWGDGEWKMRHTHTRVFCTHVILQRFFIKILKDQQRSQNIGHTIWVVVHRLSYLESNLTTIFGICMEFEPKGIVVSKTSNPIWAIRYGTEYVMDRIRRIPHVYWQFHANKEQSSCWLAYHLLWADAWPWLFMNKSENKLASIM